MSQNKVTILNKINKKLNYFLYSKWIFMIVVFFISLATIFSVYSFFFNEGVIRDETFKDWKQKDQTWIIYFWFVLCVSSSLSGIFGDIFLHRNNKKCFIFYFIFIFTYILSCIILSLWFETMEQIIMFFIVSKAYLNWGRKEKDEEIKKQKWLWTLVILIFVVIFTFLLGKGIKVWLDGTDYQDNAAYLDAFVSLSFLTGWALITKKYLQSYLFYVLSAASALTLAIEYHIWIYVVSDIFYLSFFYLGIYNWTQIYKSKIKINN
ncbi:MAG: hypothetical protein HPAVJP_4130 [Candidatus Hepatoplasma vulgare]|nr:MAG: hypothetical protein HPAVJP_4130 [Candidatus Hepatoplasma sp.]